MHETLVSVGLPVGETLNIEKVTFQPKKRKENEKRICIVTGIHGDELEGQYIAYELMRRLKENPDKIEGIIDIYPCINPLGMEAIFRGIPTFDLDMNRCFPGRQDGDMVEHIAAALVEDVQGADLCIDLHSSNIFIREVPQVRLSEKNASLFEYGKLLNVEFIWIYESPTVLDSSLVHSLNDLGVPALAIEMGVGMRINQENGNLLVEGIFSLMKEMGIWRGEITAPKKPIVSTDGQVEYIHAEASGIFLTNVEHRHMTHKGDLLGKIINPKNGTIEQMIYAPCSGMVFSLREYPVVYEGSLIARIMGGIELC